MDLKTNNLAYCKRKINESTFNILKLIFNEKSPGYIQPPWKLGDHPSKLVHSTAIDRAGGYVGQVQELQPGDALKVGMAKSGHYIQFLFTSSTGSQILGSSL